ncbi:phenylacetate--CoA ligase family protein [Candidatus Bipolaricaulota bacterium]
MANLERVYLSLPIWLQNQVVALQGWRIKRSRYNRTFYTKLKECEARRSWDSRSLRELRDLRLQAFVKHSEESVPYYRSLFREMGISSNDIRKQEDLSCLPLLTRTTVQEHYSEFLSEAVPRDQRIMVHTSGTTGAGLHLATTAEALAEQWAVWWSYRRSHGIELDTWCGYVDGRPIVATNQMKPPYWRCNRSGKQLLLSAYHMTPENIDDYLGEIRRRRIPWLHCFPSLLSLLASRTLDSGARLSYRPRWITIGAENLLPQQSDLIQEAFGIRPLQHYGLVEGVANISEWPDGCLRVDEDFSVVEFVPNPNGCGYKIIGTNLSNPAMPLLRYDTSDLAEVDLDQDELLPGGRIVKQIDGRQEDYLVLRSGARLGRMDQVFKHMTSIREAQLYQDEIGVIVVRIAKREGYSDEDEAILLREFRKRVGEETELIVEYHDALPRTESGKLRFVVSAIPKENIDAVPH